VQTAVCCALLLGDVYRWADDDVRRLLLCGSSGSVNLEQYPALSPDHCLSHTEVIKIAACGGQAAAVTKAGQVFTW